MKHKKTTFSATGNITKIDGLKTSQSGMPYRSLRVNLEGCDEQEFTVFKERAETLGNNFKDDDNVSITFTIGSRKWEDRNGSERITTQLNLLNIEKLATQQRIGDETTDIDDCPFGF